MLISHGASITIPSRYSLTPLNKTVKNNYKELVELLQKNLPKPNTYKFYQTPLQTAIKKNDLEMANFLISLGADVNEICRSDDSTALIKAVEGDNKEIVEYLLSQGADANIKSKYKTTLSAAASKENLEIIKILVDHGADMNQIGHEAPLHIAARIGNDVLVDFLISHGADVNVLDENGEFSSSCSHHE
ncbi:hypothetical protein TVAG_221290 [Trichomonas vaginalis G3]|uniref:Uncharacterized protein n=1 Tax=Trichomonas vaginalis (strain ATCC PRA-98 / G3) TaxID=412133 RepID=A2FWY5_TRIV3|nr:spectrin binding [Trichomonas vaginalis G3]EAX90586.1 hypothetical protein TVAG_221290 [Trichomonas vaginalis G3]KAI5540263.1 spectrin binding [Trichomonas vaginalis G3]|eukprot:XP_001303516.1 hypothetical protein [Trichomonas vaginalis G3]